VLLLLVALLLAACSPAATPEAPAPAPQAEPAQDTAPAAEEPTVAPAEEAPAAEEPTVAPVEEAPAAEAAAPVELEFWTMLGGDLGERVTNMVAEYNSSQNEVRINEVNMGDYEPLLEKQIASIVAGNFPPVTLIDYKTVPFFAQAGALEPIADWASEEDMQDFLPGLLGDLTYDGVVYALPFNRSYQGLYINKDLFTQAGLDPESPPKTWDEYAEYVDAIDALGPDIYGSYVYRRSHEHILSFGEPISDENCDVTVNSEQGVAALQYMQDLHYVHNALVPANMSGPFDQAAIEFIQGKVGMYSGSIAIQNRVEEITDFDTAFALLPAGPGGQAWLGGGGNIAMSATATPEQKEAAWKFINWWTSQEQSAQWHMGTGYLPVRASVSELPEVQAFYEEHPSWETSVDGVEFIFKTPCVMINVPQYVSLERPAADRVVLNQEDPQEVLDQLASELQALIDESREEGDLIIPR
jgi:ABC-type glycerol-3-phosphate transport system substrate-binding protein